MSDRAPEKRYLSYQDQETLVANLKYMLDRTHWSDLFFLKYGYYSGSLCMLVSGAAMWRIGFQAWNIQKYSKNRVLTAMIALSVVPAGSLLHKIDVKNKLLEPYRSENMWRYGFNAIRGNQLCLLVQLGFSLGYTFVSAVMANMIPVEQNFLHKKHRMNTLKYVASRLAPHKAKFITINLVSSAILFCVATRSFVESRHLLARVGRKTLSEIEE